MQSVENQRVEAHHKTTTKPPQRLPQKPKPLKIKHLRDFFVVLWFAPKSTFQAHPTRLTSQSVGTIFAGKTFVFSIHLCHTTITTTKTIKPLKIKDLSFWVSLCGGFVVALWFLAHCKNHTIIKHHKEPTDQSVSWHDFCSSQLVGTIFAVVS